MLDERKRCWCDFFQNIVFYSLQRLYVVVKKFIQILFGIDNVKFNVIDCYLWQGNVL